MQTNETWALVLAAGDGLRLRNLTTTSGGVIVPKQYCSLDGGRSLLDEALRRAGAIAAPERTCAVVGEPHRLWWAGQLEPLPESNVIVQPQNRGTANGVLRSLLWIAQRDPAARVVMIPSDHDVQDEPVLARALRRASDANAARGRIVLLGIEPREADPELGYIIPGREEAAGFAAVRQFVEKPTASHAMELLESGGLWNAFIIGAPVQTLLGLYEERYPQVLHEMRGVVAAYGAASSCALRELYEHLPNLDFSRHILQGREELLAVLPVPECGWSDLGTPQRVLEALRRRDGAGRAARAPAAAGRARLSLATRVERSLTAHGTGGAPRALTG